MNALTRLIIICLIIIFSFVILVNAASCDVSVNPSVIDADSDYSQNPGRITVFGDGAGNSFSETTNVQINCNIDNTEPGAKQNIVNARIPAFSQSLLSYTGYCSYKASNKDIGYKISATILPDKTSCNKGDNTYATVTVKASAKDTPDTACKNTDEMYDPDYKKCVGCGDHGQNKCGDGKCKNELVADARGKCTEKEKPIPPGECGNKGQKPCKFTVYNAPCTNGEKCVYGCIAPYVYDNGLGDFNKRLRPEACVVCTNNKEYEDGYCVTKRKEQGTEHTGELIGEKKESRFGLDWKWSLIGVPYGDILSEDHSCLSKVYYYDKENEKYQKVTDLTDKRLMGKGLWAKRATTGTGGCTIKYTGRFLQSQIINLKKGWNLVSLQTEKSIDTTKSTGCKITAGPYMYSGFMLNGKAQGYVKRDSMNYGNGYWIKVSEDCKLASEEEEEGPPAPPESNTQTIEPQGGKSRRFAAEAG